MVLAAFEAARLWVRFQQPVNGPCLKSGALAQSFRGPAGRRTKRDGDSLRPEDLQDRIHERGLADAQPPVMNTHGCPPTVSVATAPSSSRSRVSAVSIRAGGTSISRAARS